MERDDDWFFDKKYGVMANLETTYLGLKLKNPLVAGSSGLTGSIGKIRELEEAGIGAVVLKSVFEEQINAEVGDLLHQSNRSHDYPEADYYIQNYVRDHSIGRHTELVARVKQETRLPVIASINCVAADEWTSFAGDLEKAGADAIELFQPPEQIESGFLAHAPASDTALVIPAS